MAMYVSGYENCESRRFQRGATSASLVTNLSGIDEPRLLTTTIDHLFPPLAEERKISGFSKGISSSQVFLGSAKMLSRHKVVNQALGKIGEAFGFSSDGSLRLTGRGRDVLNRWLQNCNAIKSVLSAMFEPFCDNLHLVAGAITIDSQSLQSYDGRFRQFFGWPGVVSEGSATPLAVPSESESIAFGFHVQLHGRSTRARDWQFPIAKLKEFAWDGLGSVADLKDLIMVPDSMTCVSRKESNYNFDRTEIFPWRKKPVTQIPILDGGILCAINRSDLVHHVIMPSDVSAQASQTPFNSNWYIVNGRGVSLCRYFQSNDNRTWEDQVRLSFDPDGYLIGLGITRLELDRACQEHCITPPALTATEVGVC